MRCLRIVLTIVLVLVCSQAVAEKRVALVIGNSAYQHASRLPNPENDAPDMAAKLEGLGFEVVLGSNLDLAGVRYAIGIFVEKLADADMALFYYAGHGLQVNGENYIAPVDAKLLSYLDLEFETVPISLVLSAMERRPGINLVILDACRDNPLAANLVRSMGTRSSSVGRGLAKIGGGLNSLIAFATQPGNVAFDGAGRNSPFTAALLRHLGTPGQDITRELIDVRRDVVIETSGRQVPWDSSSLTREVVLKPMAKPEPPAAATPQHNAAELAFWDAIKASNQKDVFDAYLQQYPEGAFAWLAKAKIRIIEREAAERAAAEAQAAADAMAQPAPQASAGPPAAEQQVASVAPPATDGIGPDAAPPDREMVRSIQKELNRIGCRAGSEDGLWGAGSRRALEQFARRSRLELAAIEPSGDVLERLRTHRARVCPLACAANQEERNGRCVALQAPAKIAPQPAGPQPPDSRRKAFANCPANAKIALIETVRRGSAHGRNVMTATHACGREFTCRRPGRGRRAGPWDCSWL
jgi:uncharacterized caspase-like protein